MSRAFVGRKHELAELNRLYESDAFEMVVLYGRRRVGKTALALKFAENKPLLYFTAKVQSDALNLAGFSRQIYEHFGIPAGAGAFARWDDAFSFIAKHAASEHLVLVFDEFPYAAQKNASLLSTLQIAIDRELAKTNVFLILSGSNQGFMEEKVLGDTAISRSERALGEKNPLFGRRTAQIHLEPLGYLDAAKLLPNTPPEELVEYYACFGGTPYYLSRIDESLSLAENVEHLFFNPSGLLYDEPLMLLRQEVREPSTYSSILDAIANGANRPQLISDRIGEERSSTTKYLNVLNSMGLIHKQAPFGEPAAKSRKGIYSLKDPCFAFWYAFVQPRIDSIEQGAGDLAARELFRGNALSTYVGHWFETICLAWIIAQARTGNLPLEATRFGSWWGANPAKQERDDIDVIAADPFAKTLLMGECKWRGDVNVSKVVTTLDSRRNLIAGYEATGYALFTKKPIALEVQQHHADKVTLFVTPQELYGKR